MGGSSRPGKDYASPTMTGRSVNPGTPIASVIGAHGRGTDGHGGEAPQPIQEQEIMAVIQELQWHLWKLKQDQAEEAKDREGRIADGPFSEKGRRTRRLIMVSSNLPVVLKQENANHGHRWKILKSDSGLDKLLCLRGVKDEMPFLWVGWVGVDVAEENKRRISKRLVQEHDCVPVFLPSDIASMFCSQSAPSFSGNVLWKVFHYLSFSGEESGKSSTFDYSSWSAYKTANMAYADALADLYQEGDVIWIQDYHFMLLPTYLRQRIPNCTIGWFLHTPFPSSDVYLRLPVRKELLEGILGADLVGFQTYDYARHFLSACQQVLDVKCSPKGLVKTAWKDHTFTSLGVYPIGVNMRPFKECMARESTKRRMRELAAKFSNRRILLGVDRMDLVKGIPHKLLALEALLHSYPQWRNNVVLIQLGFFSPTGESVNDDSEVDKNSRGYQRLLNKINKLAGRINGTYGTLDYAPVHFINSAVDREELCALYSLADVCVVTSTRDGMNLVGHEYITCQSEIRLGKSNNNNNNNNNNHSHNDKTSNNNNGDLTNNNTSNSKAGGSILTENALSSAPESGPGRSDFAAAAAASAAENHVSSGASLQAREGPGVLVLSEFTGSAHALNGALLVNPWNAEEVANALNQALVMSQPERELRLQKLLRFVSTNTAGVWAKEFLHDLHTAAEKSTTMVPRPLGLPLTDVFEQFRAAAKRVIILDYHFPSALYQLLPLDAKALRSPLKRLCSDPRNIVYVVSGGERKMLESSFDIENLGLVAEEGYYTRPPGSQRWEEHQESMTEAPANKWKPLVREIMQDLCDRAHGSYLEEKEGSMAWCYGETDPELGAWQAKDLQITLERSLAGTRLQVCNADSKVEVRHQHCDKIVVLDSILKLLKAQGEKLEFVFALSQSVGCASLLKQLRELRLVRSPDLQEERTPRDAEQAPDSSPSALPSAPPSPGFDWGSYSSLLSETVSVWACDLDESAGQAAKPHARYSPDAPQQADWRLPNLEAFGQLLGGFVALSNEDA